MKKYILILILTTCILNINVSPVKASEILDITKESKIKYKWYKEKVIDSTYYPKMDKLEGYKEDATKTINDNYTSWDKKYCSYSKENYNIEKKEQYLYNSVQESQYIKIKNINYDEIKTVKVYSKTQEIKYEIFEKKENSTIINLKKNYDINDLWFIIDTEKEYDIILSAYQNYMLQTLSKHIVNEKILIPDETWITKETVTVTKVKDEKIENTVFTQLKGTESICRVGQIKTYRYKTNKVYYDNNYYTYIEGYLPDINDYIVEYSGTLPVDTVEITKLLKDKQIEKEYIYISNDNQTIQNNDSSHKVTEIQKNTLSEPIIETKYIENEVIKTIYKIPKKIYIIILILILIIIFQILKIKNKVDKKI